PFRLTEFTILMEQIAKSRQDRGVIHTLTQELKKERHRYEEYFKDILFIKKLHARLFPTEFSWLKRTRVHIQYLPMDAGGGDYIDVRPYGEHRALILVVDVSGHGIPAMFGCIALKAFLSSIRIGLLPDQILTQAEKVLSETLPEEFYATAFCGIYNERDRTLHYALAACPFPFILSPLGNGQLLKGDGFALCMAGEMTRECHKTTLKEGEVLMVYTDGLIHNSYSHFEKLNNRFRVSENSGTCFKNITNLVTTVMDTAIELTPTRAFSDDIAILALGPDYPSHSNKLAKDDIFFDNVSLDWMDFVISSSSSALDMLGNYLSVLKQQAIPADVLEDILYCIREIAGNAIEWGNHYHPEFKVRISTVVLKDRIMVKIADEGSGFDVNRAFLHENNIETSQLEREKLGKRDGGFGLLLVQQKMDSLKFNDKGNVVLMTKMF
ncbi:MAG: SpoIIE family protein phosphatase, partial [Desulfobacterales bacterium]|nr:SpoIIE family protein phosphatase [Desulfobacterales bacterium]